VKTARHEQDPKRETKPMLMTWYSIAVAVGTDVDAGRSYDTGIT
jgi:hypothetical protein